MAHHFQRPFGCSLSGVAVRGRILRPYLGPVALQFLADHHGVGGPDPLAELRLPDPDRYCVVRRDDDPGVDLRRRRILVPDGARSSLRVRPRRDPEAKNEGSLCRCDHREEFTTIDAGPLVLAHWRLPAFIRSAAKWIACRTRW